MIIVFVLIILEGAITMDVFLNTNWEEVKSSSAVRLWMILSAIFLISSI